MNGLAVLISKVKTTIVSPRIIKECDIVAKSIAKKATAARRARTNDDQKILTWFSPSAITELSALLREIENTQQNVSERTFNILLLSFGYTARRVSYQRWREFKLYRIPASDRLASKADVAQIFENHVGTTTSALASLYSSSAPIRRLKLHLEITVADAKSFNPSCSPNLIITSPPYGDASTTIAYDQFSYLASLWLHQFGVKYNKLNPTSTKRAILNSPLLQERINLLEQSDANRASQVSQFYDGIVAGLSQAHDVLAENGRLCLVVGGRTVKGISFPMNAIVSELALTIGFKKERTFERVITSKRIAPRNSVSQTINTESIEVFRRN